MPRFPRTSGILAHPTSLPGPGAPAIGDLRCANHFLDFLARARQRLWQVLPLGPTGYGDSPYASPSAFAGNVLLVALAPLVEDGLLTGEDLGDPARSGSGGVDYGRAFEQKHGALGMAYARFRDGAAGHKRDAFEAFRSRERAWLDDYALFMTLHQVQSDWTTWEAGLRDRHPDALAAARERYSEDVGYHAFAQFLFFEQWDQVHRRARELGIRIVGDIPIFVAHDSADVWAHREIFKLDEHGRPRVVAGVPPDYFSETGQLWGNPLYDWERLRQDGYLWWLDRFRQLRRIVDVVRIDHFRGFEAAWEVPAGAPTAQEGAWVKGPGADVFRAVERDLHEPLPVIAEDLGLITDEVRALLGDVGFPGMKVLQFAFGSEVNHPYLPHSFQDPNCVVYTGTHDNDTTPGWWRSLDERARDHVCRYLGTDGSAIHWDLVRLALGSIADTAIIPLQDVLGLGSEARMNMPGAAEGNWTWRATADQLSHEAADRLAALTTVYGRAE